MLSVTMYGGSEASAVDLRGICATTCPGDSVFNR